MEPSVIKDHSSTTSRHHQDGEIPQRIIQHARSGGRKDQYPREFIRDCLLRQLNCCQGNDAHCRRVQAREKSVGRAWEGVSDA
jgi:hypothetical protein